MAGRRAVRVCAAWLGGGGGWPKFDARFGYDAHTLSEDAARMPRAVKAPLIFAKVGSTSAWRIHLGHDRTVHAVD
jgi:hypothetical protein